MFVSINFLQFQVSKEKGEMFTEFQKGNVKGYDQETNPLTGTWKIYIFLGTDAFCPLRNRRHSEIRGTIKFAIV